MSITDRKHIETRSLRTAKLVLLFLICIHTSFAQNRVDALRINDEVYGPDSLQKMDVYLLANRSLHTPLVVLVHGGGWMAGDKEACNFMRDFLSAQGANIININYRLASSGKISYVQIMQDIDLAIAHVVRKSNDWFIRSKGLTFWGGSAGGHLAMLYAYRFDKRHVISAVMSLGGPTKLDDLQTLAGAKQQDLDGLLPLITGDPWQPGDLADSYKNASPYYGESFRPTLLMHGGKDDIVPPGQAKLMYEKLKREGVDTEIIVLSNGAHGGEGAPLEEAENMAQSILRWVRKYSQ